MDDDDEEEEGPRTRTSSEGALLSGGRLTVGTGAIIICLRESRTGQPDVLSKERFGSAKETFGKIPQVDQVFRGKREIDFGSQGKGFEVLLGQRQCANWVRSSGLGADQVRFQRYPGEFAFAGGGPMLDKGDELWEAARRGLQDEWLSPLGLTLPAEARLRPLLVKQTGVELRAELSRLAGVGAAPKMERRSDLIWAYVALEEENPWLKDLGVDATNAPLAAKHAQFNEAAYFDMPLAQKEKECPPVRELRWLPLGDAVFQMLSTTVANGSLKFCVNEWQASELQRLGIKKRESMMFFARMLLELATFPSAKAILNYVENRDGFWEKRIDPEDGLAYTYEEMLAYYKDSGENSSEKEIKEWWDNSWRPVRKGDDRAWMAMEQRKSQHLYSGMQEDQIKKAVRDWARDEPIVDGPEVARLRAERQTPDAKL